MYTTFLEPLELDCFNVMRDKVSSKSGPPGANGKTDGTLCFTCPYEEHGSPHCAIVPAAGPLSAGATVYDRADNSYDLGQLSSAVIQFLRSSL